MTETIGAIDPARMHLTLRMQSTTDHATPELAIALINNFLVGELRSARTDTQDRVAYAIQELLRLLGQEKRIVFFYQK